MTLSDKQIAFTEMFAHLILYAKLIGRPIKVQEWNRSVDQQTKYVAEGKSQTLDSKHLKNLAVDVAMIIDGKYITDPDMYKPLGNYWRDSLGQIWGGDWSTLRDAGHFEYKEV